MSPAARRRGARPLAHVSASRPGGSRTSGTRSGQDAGVPTAADFPYCHSATPVALAHRGGALSGLENSMSAFARAVALGYRHLETDAHVTADGVLLAFHDNILDRVTDRSGRLAALPWSVVQQARIGGREPIPTMAELFATWPDVRINIDVKSAAAIAPLLELVDRSAAWDRVCVGSFSDARLRLVRRAAGPRLATSMGPLEVAALKLAAYVPATGPPLAGQTPLVQVPLRFAGIPVLDGPLIRAAHRLGRRVHAWTINDPEQMDQLLDLDVDGIMTDSLEALCEVFAARGLPWPPL